MQLCIYCQSNPGETDDHVPPKSLFPKPRPSNLITVPACDQCNKSFKNDDEYFLNIALEWAASESSDGRQIADNRLRSMKRKESRRFWQSLVAKTEPVEVRTPSGLYLANSLEVRLDGGRIARTITRIVKGLYFEITKKPIPIGANVVSMQFSEFRRTCNDLPDMEQVIQAIPKFPGRFIGKDTFEFRYLIFNEASFFSVWFIQFYRRHGFIATTGLSNSVEDLQPSAI